MVRIFIAFASLLVGSLPAQAAIKVTDIRVFEAPLGPERKSLVMTPGEQIFVRFNAEQVATDASGKADINLQIQLIDKKGDSLINSSTRINAVVALGNNQLPCTTNVNLGLDAKPGEYTLKVIVNDNKARESTSFERKLTCKKGGFRVVRRFFFYDKDGQIPAPPGGMVGQMLFFRILATGIDRTGKKLQLSMRMQTLDSKGKELMAKPFIAKISTDDPKEIEKAEIITFSGFLALTRAGNFRLSILLRDEISGRTTTYDAPLYVVEPK